MKKVGMILLWLGCAAVVIAAGLEYGEFKPIVRSAESPSGTTQAPPAALPETQNAAHESNSDISGFERIPPRPRTPLEDQIQELERQLQNSGRSTPLDPETYQRLKTELAALYDQRPREREHLDDGADSCPAMVFPAGMVPYVDYGSTIGAADNFNSFAPCTGNSAPDKIYSYVPAQGGYYSIDTFGSNFDTQLYVRTGGVCPGNTTIVCNDDFGGSQSRVTAWLFQGQTYFIIVDGFSNYSGNFTLRVSGDCAVGNQNDWQQECAESVGDPSHAAWDCNGGCNNQWYGGFPQWQQINLCQFVRGSCFTYLDPNSVSIRDIDSYYFTLSEPCSLTLTLFSTFSYNVLINDYGFCLPNNHVSLLNIPQCNGGMYVTQCLPAGTYSIEISPNFYTNMPDPQAYFFKVDPIPCSGCRIDGSDIAPTSFISNSCGGNDNSLRPSTDATYCIIIPYASDWTFSLCSSQPWNSYLYVTAACDGQIIAQDDDGCDSGGLSTIECLPLTPGNYYVTIEGATALDCGQFYLFVTACVGACCYGNDPYNLQCSYGSLSSCDALSGEFTLGQQCNPEVCGVRPACFDSAQFSQQPYLPTEAWTAVASDTYIGYSLWEDYSVAGVISAVRFWGLFTDFNNGLPCLNQPTAFQITFVDSANGPAVQTYNVNATAYLIPQNYGANYPIYQYTVNLPTACTILSGRVSVKSTDGDACVFAWMASGQGNGSVVLHNPGGPVDLPMDMAVCMERGCPVPDSVVINTAAVNNYEIHFYLPEASYARLYYATDVNAVFPVGYSVLAAGSLTPGHWFGTDTSADPQRRYVVTAQCGVPPISLTEPVGAFRRAE